MFAIALADDTTGALEVGAKLCQTGVRSLVWLEHTSGLPEEWPGLVLELATRHLAPQDAARRVREAGSWAREKGAPYIFLKTDSTLRGPIGAELGALLDVWPDRTLVYVPAYPAMGRRVREGVLYVNGQPVSETAFAHDPREPVRESSVLRLLARECPAPSVLVRSATELAEALADDVAGRILVCDAQEERDLEAIAEVLAGCAEAPLAAGTGGFAGHWFLRLPLPREGRPTKLMARRWLVVNGSLHPRSREQAALADVPRIACEGRWPSGATWALIETHKEPSAEPTGAAAELAATVAHIVREHGVEGLVIFGGDTARAVLEALGVQGLEACGELLAGIPISRALGADLLVVTKAGGFGPPDVVARIRGEIERWR